jgi:hypothetical protein
VSRTRHGYPGWLPARCRRALGSGRLPGLDTALAQGPDAREVRLRPSALTPSALRALAAFMYTDRLDAPIEDAEVLVRAVRAGPAQPTALRGRRLPRCAW